MLSVGAVGSSTAAAQSERATDTGKVEAIARELSMPADEAQALSTERLSVAPVVPVPWEK